jgi:FixJ family two-component response regulator
MVELSPMRETISSTVAIVDDDPRIRVSVGDLLESAGFTAKAFFSAEDFLGACDQRKISCLIVDMRMPGISGLQLLEKMKKDQPDLPVVIVTGHDDDNIQERALSGGAAAFFLKPFNGVELLKTVEGVSRQFNVRGEVPSD